MFRPARRWRPPCVARRTRELSAKRISAPRTLVHSAWFDFACARLGGAEALDQMLGRELYRLSLYADLVPIVAGHAPWRIFRTAPFLRDDGQLIRLWIYFALRPDGAVELQHIEATEENMSGPA